MKPTTNTSTDNDRCSEDPADGTPASPEGLTRRTFLRQSATITAQTCPGASETAASARGRPAAHTRFHGNNVLPGQPMSARFVGRVLR